MISTRHHSIRDGLVVLVVLSALAAVLVMAHHSGVGQSMPERATGDAAVEAYAQWRLS